MLCLEKNHSYLHLLYKKNINSDFTNQFGKSPFSQWIRNKWLISKLSSTKLSYAPQLSSHLCKFPSMAFYGYNADVDNECYWTPYSSADYELGVITPHYSSPYELGKPYPIDYTYAYYKDHYSEPINFTTSFDYYEYPSETNYTQPKFLHYTPLETRFIVSYNNVEFNEPEFEEYDPTPYDGGYDQRLTYGKPLPPSDFTCYPRSMPQSDGPTSDNFSYEAIPSPYGKDDNIPIEPPKKIKPTDAVGDGGKDADIVDVIPKVDSPSYGGKDSDIVDVIPKVDSPSYGMGGDYAHVSQIPYGSGLEAMDLCESIFGYWPCLAKNAQQQQQHWSRCRVCDRGGGMDDPWRNAADYFFGSPVPYEYDSYHHHQSPYQSDQVSWLQ